jgi:hypothetical protein
MHASSASMIKSGHRENIFKILLRRTYKPK